VLNSFGKQKKISNCFLENSCQGHTAVIMCSILKKYILENYRFF